MVGDGMNEQIKAGADIHAGDGGYEIGTKEQYEAFVKIRNQSLNIRIRELMVQAGYAAPEYASRAHQLVELVVRECIAICESGTPTQTTSGGAAELIKQHFGVVTKQHNS